MPFQKRTLSLDNGGRPRKTKGELEMNKDQIQNILERQDPENNPNLSYLIKEGKIAVIIERNNDDTIKKIAYIEPSWIKMRCPKCHCAIGMKE